jgi:hypothetical protein
MKILFIILILLISISGYSQFRKHFKKKTCRIDYFHSGSAQEEHYEVDRIVIEPFYSGTRDKLIDPFDYGNYKFHVVDSATGELLYSRGYSSLFLEYRSTEEAKTECGNYPESVTFPLPKNTVRVDFYSRGKDQVWEKKHETFVNPDDPAIVDNRKKKRLRYEGFKVHYSGNPKKKLDIVFLPEGYTSSEMEKYFQDCEKFKDYLLECEPYTSYRDEINIWGVMAPSEEPGTDLPGDSIWKNTLLNTNFYTFGSERYLTTDDYTSVMDVASCAPSDAIVILVNHPKYGGGGIYNFWCVTTTDDKNAAFLLVHEFGHSFAGLGDEYYTSDVAVQDFYDLTKEPWEPNLTTMVDFDSKWRSMLPPGTPVPTPASKDFEGRTGVFEGGGYAAKGIFRPYMDCTMNVIKYDNFCPVCRGAIGEMIEFYLD